MIFSQRTFVNSDKLSQFISIQFQRELLRNVLSVITKGVLELADYFGLIDFPKPKPTPIDELITLDLNGEKKIKILKRTITRHSKTDIAKFFKGKTSENFQHLKM